MSNAPPNPDFPPQQYTARYELGWETDREAVDLTEAQWDFVYRGVENYILCEPTGDATWEVEGWEGVRFLMTDDVPAVDAPPLIVWFKHDDETRRVAFLTVQRVPPTPDYVGA